MNIIKAVVENGIIVNVIVCAVDFQIAGKTLVELPEGFGIGDLFDGTSFTKQPQEPIEE